MEPQTKKNKKYHTGPYMAYGLLVPVLCFLGTTLLEHQIAVAVFPITFGIVFASSAVFWLCVTLRAAAFASFS